MLNSWKRGIEMEKYLDLKNDKDYTKIKEASKIINNGGLVLFPTETVYGIGTSAFCAESVEKIYKIKKRPHEKPINVLVSNFDMIKLLAKDISPMEEKIMKKFFPGPLTIILKKNDNVPDVVTSGGDTIGIRMPANDVALKLIEKAGVPLATTSANYSGAESLVDFEKIKNEFPADVDYLINGGKSRIGVASTIVKVGNDNIKILRQGSIKKEDLDNIE